MAVVNENFEIVEYSILGFCGEQLSSSGGISVLPKNRGMRTTQVRLVSGRQTVKESLSSQQRRRRGSMDDTSGKMLALARGNSVQALDI